MTGPSAQTSVGKQPDWDVPKQRNCLRCRTSYRSEWSGDRICPRCKNTKAWKDGGGLKSGSTHTGR